MVGFLLGFHLTVFVVVIFQHLMHLIAPMVFFLPSDITTSVTLLHHFFLKFVMMLRLNIIINHFLERILDTRLQFVMIMPVLIATLLVFGGNCHQHAFFDVCVFNSFAPSYRWSTLSATYCKREQEKCRAYEERICVVVWLSMAVLLF